MNTNIEQLIRSTNGKFFTVEFIKKDGSPRKMNARIGVAKNLTGTGMSWSPREKKMMVAFDMQKHDYRMINLETVTSFRCGNTAWARA